jgi:hypothetical protein
LLKDKAYFTRNGTLKTHNQHMWSGENLNSLQEPQFQLQFTINVWVEIIYNLLFGTLTYSHEDRFPYL